MGRFFHREIVRVLSTVRSTQARDDDWANILINKDLHACLTNFIFSTIVGKQRDAASNASSTSESSGGSHSLTTPRGAYRWMSPELLLPDTHRITDFRPTKQSDCYALGIVVCEVRADEVIPLLRSFDLSAVRFFVEPFLIRTCPKLM